MLLCVFHGADSDKQGINKMNVFVKSMFTSCGVDWSIKGFILHHDDPALLPRWTDAAAFHRLFHRQLEDHAARVLQPSYPTCGNLLLVSYGDPFF